MEKILKTIIEEIVVLIMIGIAFYLYITITGVISDYLSSKQDKQYDDWMRIINTDKKNKR